MRTSERHRWWYCHGDNHDLFYTSRDQATEQFHGDAVATCSSHSAQNNADYAHRVAADVKGNTTEAVCDEVQVGIGLRERKLCPEGVPAKKPAQRSYRRSYSCVPTELA